MKFITAETVSPGHPDKIADLISDYVLFEALSQDKSSKVAVETFLTGTQNGGLIVVGGEISESIDVNDAKIEKIVKEALSTTIKTNFPEFDINRLQIQNVITPQSEEIRSAVEDDKNQGAGDQGIMIGFATNKTESYMPNSFDIARKIQMELWNLQKTDSLLDLDAKVQITTGGKKTKVVVSVQHKQEINMDILFSDIYSLVSNFVNTDFSLDLNTSGSFIKGGPAGDTGLTGRKIVVDAYGPTVPVGGGAFSGKDPSKVDRSGAYAARHLAKNIVANKFADKCLVRIAYAIGKADPYEITVDTFDGESNPALNDFIKRFDMRPQSIIERLELLDVDYRTDAMFSHFGHPGRTWERIESL